MAFRDTETDKLLIGARIADTRLRPSGSACREIAVSGSARVVQQGELARGGR